MITAYILNAPLDLPREFSFDLVQQSQLFSFDKLCGDYCPQISFPDTERNRAMLNHPNRFELERTRVKEYEGFELRSDGFLLLRGTLVLTSQFTGFVRGSIGNLSVSQQDKFITDCDLATGITPTYKATYDPATDDYCYPTIVNQNFFAGLTTVRTWQRSDESTYEETMLQHQHRTNAFMVNFKVGGVVQPYTDQILTKWGDYEEKHNGAYTQRINPISPMWFLFRFIKKILSKNGFNLVLNELSTTDFGRLVIYNNFSIVDLLQELGDSNLSLIDWDEVFNAIPLDYFYQTTTLFDEKNLLPKITLKELLLSVQNLLNCAFVFKGEEASIIDRENVLTAEPTDQDIYFTGSWLLAEKKNVTLVFNIKHDENDFLFSTYYQDLSDRSADFGADVATFDALQALANPTIGELRRVLDQQKIYEYAISTIDLNGKETDCVMWKFASIDFQFAKVNAPTSTVPVSDAEPINTTASTCAYTGMAVVMQAGRFNLRKDTEAAFSLRLLFDQNGVGKNNTANYILKWENSANALLNKRWLNFSQFWAHRQPVEGYFRYPVSILANIDLNHKHSTRNGHYLIEKMTTRFSHAGIGETKIEGYKV